MKDTAAATTQIGRELYKFQLTYIILVGFFE